MTDEEQAEADRLAEEKRLADEVAVKPKPVKGRPKLKFNQVYIEAETGPHGIVDLPEGVSPKERRITLNGKNFEHVGDDPETGTWIYRQMPG